MAYLEINVTSQVPIYQQIMDQVRALVSRGTLAAGRPLPSVRQLAAELGINPNTVAKAYQLLEMEGTIVTLKRRGAFVGEASSAQAALARKRRVAEVLDRLLEEARRLGLSKKDIMHALAMRGEEGPEPGEEIRKKTGESPDRRVE